MEERKYKLTIKIKEMKKYITERMLNDSIADALKGVAYQSMFRFETSQTGTSDPTVKVLVNGLHVGYTLTRIDPGSYNLVFTSTAGYTPYPQNEPPLVIKDVGTILLIKKNETEYIINTLDTNGVETDGILDRLVVTIEFYKV